MSAAQTSGVDMLVDLLVDVAISRGYVDNLIREFAEGTVTATITVRTMPARLGTRSGEKIIEASMAQRDAARAAFDKLADAMSASLAPHERFELAERNATMWTERMLAAKTEVDHGAGEAARRRAHLAAYIMEWLRDRNAGRHAATIPKPDEEDHEFMLEELRMILEHGGKPPNWVR